MKKLIVLCALAAMAVACGGSDAKPADSPNAVSADSEKAATEKASPATSSAPAASSAPATTPADATKK
ncbi:MAG: hypothetical protein FWD69_01270 [Polyangiaceae bacterium]|nr:hypothetical protein [Polyangiaceae bacterium]